MNLGVMNRAGWYQIGVPGLETLVRLALDDEISFALQQVSHFYPRMGVASGAAAGGNFSDPGDGIVAVRKLGFLQRRALDAALLRDRCTGAGKRDEAQSD